MFSKAAELEHRAVQSRSFSRTTFGALPAALDEQQRVREVLAQVTASDVEPASQLALAADTIEERFDNHTLTTEDLQHDYVKQKFAAMSIPGLILYADACSDAQVKAHVLSLVDVFDPAKLEAASAYASGTGHSTLYGTSQTSTLGAIKKQEATKGTLTYTTSGPTIATEDEYYEAVDVRYSDRNAVTANKVTDSQAALLAIARKAARNADYFDQVIASNESAQSAEIDYSVATKANDAYTFSPVLEHRIGRYHRFMFAVGLYTINNPQPLANAALRERATAHKWSTEFYITQDGTHVNANQKDAIVTNFISMFNNPSYFNDEFICDEDNTNWARKTDFVDAQGNSMGANAALGGSGPGVGSAPGASSAASVDKDKTWDNIKAYVDTLNFRSDKTKIASEGYDSNDSKRLPNASSVSVSNHIYGNALDFPSAGFVAKNDPINDYIAWEFGLQRNVSGETWHFECTGRPIRDEEKAFDAP